MDISRRADQGPRRFAFPLGDGNPAQYSHASVNGTPHNKDFAVLWRGGPGATHADYTVEELKRYRPKVIAVWMRKGGVGKTNLVYMLGHALAKQGCRTLMVDCDSQQDLTELCFRSEAEAADEADIEEYLRTKLPNADVANPSATRHKSASAARNHRGIADLANAVRYPLKMETNCPPRPPHAPVCNLLVPFAFPVGTTAGMEGLYLVQGGSRFEEMENCLKVEWSHEMNPNRNAPGALFHAIWNAGRSIEGVGADVILLDLSPALGTTNQALICHCDYFICPCQVDKLCEKNLKSISGSLQNWYRAVQRDGTGHPCSGIRDISRGLTIVSEEEGGDTIAELPLPEIEPKFLGIIFNRYDVKKKCVLVKRDRAGNPLEVPEVEKLKSRSRTQMAHRLLMAARELSERLSRDPKTVNENGFSVHDDVFTQDGPGKGQFRHARGTEFCPQPQLLACVKKATPLFEAAISNLGLPITMIQELDVDVGDKVFIGADKYDTFEDIAHYRRVFEDLAKFVLYLPQPEPYNFYYDPAANVRIEGKKARRF